jgi:predicted nucleotidyltransferase
VDEGLTAVSDLIVAFKARLQSGATAAAIVREMVTHGSAVMLDEARYAALREETGSRLGVSPNRDVYLVGSAKLGFSIKPKRRYFPFGDDSDVDLAVVSSTLYEKLWAEARRYRRTGGLWDDLSHFRNDHLNGVIKPYVLPDSGTVPTKRMLFDFGVALQRTKISPYSVTLASWHNIDALEDYQAFAVKECIEELQL